VVYDLVTGMGQVESHVLTEWQNDSSGPRVDVLKPGFFGAVRQIRQYCRDQGIDVVHLHKDKFALHALLLSVTGIKCVLTVHGCGWRLARWPLPFRAAVFMMDCLVCLWGPRVVFVGERDWAFFQRLFWFRKLHLIKNGVTTTNGSSDKAKGMVYVGRLSPEKNIMNLIQAAESSTTCLDLYGPFDRHDPDYQPTVLETLGECRHVHWRGILSFDQVRQTLSRYRYFVNPSYSEGLPISVLEAAAEGLYLVLSDIPPHRLLGFPACTYVDPDHLSLANLSTNGSDGASNRDHAGRTFGMDAMITAYQDVYGGTL